MRIGIDIDGVLTNLYEFVINNIPKYCMENNIEYSISDINYDHSKTFNITKTDEMNFWNENLQNYAIKEKARPFVSSVISKLKKRITKYI